LSSKPSALHPIPFTLHPGLASSAVWASVRGQRGVAEAAARLGGARGYCSAPRVAPRQGPVGWVSLALTCATGGGLLYYYERERSRRLESISGKTGPSVGKAAIGGDFTLQNANQDGKKFSTTELHGKYALIYFGFTMVRGELEVPPRPAPAMSRRRRPSATARRMFRFRPPHVHRCVHTGAGVCTSSSRSVQMLILDPFTLHPAPRVLESEP